MQKVKGEELMMAMGLTLSFGQSQMSRLSTSIILTRRTCTQHGNTMY